MISGVTIQRGFDGFFALLSHLPFHFALFFVMPLDFPSSFSFAGRPLPLHIPFPNSISFADSFRAAAAHKHRILFIEARAAAVVTVAGKVLI